MDSLDAAGSPPAVSAWRQALQRKLGQLQYSYFNWRQDTWSDLQLFMTLNLIVFLGGAWVEGAVIRTMDDTVASPPAGSGVLTTLWYDLYNVLAVVLGQDLPQGEAGWPSQLFAIVTAVFGLASFALVLALIEQVVLEVLERNVTRGSKCYESGHIVVLAWCESSRDIAQLTRILTQLCAANRGAGGGVVVVLTQQRGKLEMEQLFREVVPDGQRFNTRFVFRQGSPLDPAALRLVAAADARSIIVCGDYSRLALDADAQVLRSCVLLDELIQQEAPPGSKGPRVVAQMKTEDAMLLAGYACSPRVIPVLTNKINARRYVRLLHHPIAAVFSRCLTDFYSPAHACVDRCPEAEGLTFGELHFRFPDALVVGLHNEGTGYCQINPPPDQVLQAGDDILMLRPSRVASGQYCELPAADLADSGEWDSQQYTMRSHDEQPLGSDMTYSFDTSTGISARPSGATLAPAPYFPGSELTRKRSGNLQGLYVLPLEYANTVMSADELLICGWMGQTFMWELLAELDHSSQALPPGSRVTLFNEHNWTPELLEERCRQYNINSLELRHAYGDPRSRSEMKRQLDVQKFKAAIVVCDSMWAVSGGGDAAERSGPEGGQQLLSQAAMLSLDSAVLMVQLNIRMLLEEVGHPSISIICEKLTYVGVTRFEDDTRLPMGIAVNSASYAAKALAQIAVEPRFLRAYMELGAESDLVVQDASEFAALGEMLSFLQLQARAASVRQIMLGWYRIPSSTAEPVEMVVNPQGLEERGEKRVWNAGDSRCKLVTMAVTKKEAAPGGGGSSSLSSMGSGDNLGSADGASASLASAEGETLGSGDEPDIQVTITRSQPAPR